jgi:predicted nucleotidyltransferase
MGTKAAVQPSPAAILFGSSRQAVLATLFTSPDAKLHLREIARRAGVGLGAVQRELARLTSAELIVREKVGHQVHFTANRNHPLYPELHAIFVKTTGIADRIRGALRPLSSGIEGAFIYGSFARGEARPDSDVDVMVIGELPFAEVTRALWPIQDQLQREINPSVYKPEEFTRKLAARHHFLTQVMAGPKIPLIGSEDEFAPMATKRLGPSSRHQP